MHLGLSGDKRLCSHHHRAATSSAARGETHCWVLGVGRHVWWTAALVWQLAVALCRRAGGVGHAVAAAATVGGSEAATHAHVAVCRVRGLAAEVCGLLTRCERGLRTTLNEECQ